MIVKPTAASPQASPASDPGAARQRALLAILTMLIAILALNVASYSIAALTTRLSTTPPKSNERQDWQIAFLHAPATIKACFGANIFVGGAGCLVLVHTFFTWITALSHVSVTVRNYAMAYGIGAGIMAIVCVHVVLVPRLQEGEGFLMIINSIAASVLAGLTFGTIN